MQTRKLPTKIIASVVALMLAASCVGFGVLGETAWADDTVSSATNEVDGSNLSYSEAVSQIRQELCERVTEPFSVIYISDAKYDSTAFFDDLYAHTKNPVEGDYLRYTASPSINVTDEFQDENGVWYTELLVEPAYVGFQNNPYEPDDAAAVEAYATEQCEEIITSLDLDGKSTWECVSEIYNYIRTNMVYDYENVDNFDYLIVYTPYDALINGCGSCLSFSTLMYRLMLMCGVDCRIINGYYGSDGHSWNIVGMDDGYYYNCDVTSDLSTNIIRSHFLCGTEDFNNGLHQAGDDYTPLDKFFTDEWCAEYPIPETRYNDQDWDACVQFGDSYTYTGSQITPHIKVCDHLDNILVEGVDYEVSYADNIEVGIATATVTGLGDYASYPRVVLTFEIIPKESNQPILTYISLDYAEISGIDPWYFYSGSTHISDKPIVEINGNVLEEGIDYTLEYINSDSVGTGTVNIIGSAENGKYNSENIAYTGTVSVDFEIINRFADVDLEFASCLYQKMWYFDSVYSLRALGVVGGYSDNTFGVGDTMTRADFVTMLWRYLEPDAYANYNEDNAKNETSLPDVTDGQYWTGAANWAVSNGIVTGKQLSDGSYEFAPYDPVSFDQMVTILARYVLGVDNADTYPTAVLSDSRFTDGNAVGDWAAGSMSWAIDSGIVTGNDNGDGTYTIAPLSDVARERACTVLWRCIENSLI